MDSDIRWAMLGRRALQRLALGITSAACKVTRGDLTRPVAAMGLSFRSPLGIAAGFDQNGRLARRVATLGFGFTEIGSLTAAQTNDLGDIPQGPALLGINLTLDARNSSAECRVQLRNAWRQADYLMLNLIGPASAPLLHQPARLRGLLVALREEQQLLNHSVGRHVPLAVKLRCLPGQIPFSLTGLLLELSYDGVLAAHDPGPPATRQRYDAWRNEHQQALACEQIEQLHRFCGDDMALMSVGGIQTAEHLAARLQAGARLVQIHAALLRQGPWVARRLLR